MTGHQAKLPAAGKAATGRPWPYRYAVVDLASAPQLASMVMGRLRVEAQPLLSPDMHEEILSVGPWLVDLSLVPDLETTVRSRFADVPWGYFVEAAIDIVSLRRALRRYNLAVLPDPTREVLFRYWDPRVMKVFLQIASRKQRDVLFEFIDRVEGPYGGFEARKSDLGQI